MPRSRALVIDNDADILDLVAMWLRARGYDVVTADSAADGLKLYREAAEPFTLLVSDVAMPVMTGLEMVKELRASGETVPVLLITAFGDPMMKPQAEAAGANGLLIKPFNSDELGRSVMSLESARRMTGGAVKKESFVTPGKFP